MVADTSMVLQPGPWEHRQVSANGARFHVALAGNPGDPLVVLVHGFPGFWWEWRDVIPRLAASGCRVAAIDLRGFGASDKPHRSISLPKFAYDVAGVISSLGYAEATVAGRGIGGHVAWTMASHTPEVVSGIVPISAPHPLALSRTAPTRAYMAWRWRANAAPGLARRLRSRDAVQDFLSTWTANPSEVLPQADLYKSAMQLPFAATCAAEAVRWLVPRPVSSEKRRFLREIEEQIRVPVLMVAGTKDRMYRRRAWSRSAEWAPGAQFVQITGSGSFTPEEKPAETARHILSQVAAR